MDNTRCRKRLRALGLEAAKELNSVKNKSNKGETSNLAKRRKSFGKLISGIK